MAAFTEIAEVKLLDTEVRQMLKQVEDKAVDVTPVWLEFHQYMRVMVDNMFQKNRLGGTWRGESWSYFKDQYTRKGGRDGTGDKSTVPAWGGVPRVGRGKDHIGNLLGKRHTPLFRTHSRVTGNVLGKMRPSGARVKQGDAILQDTNTLRGQATASVFVRSAAMLKFGANLKYAAAQNERRKFLFFALPQDAEELTRILARHFLRKTGQAAA